MKEEISTNKRRLDLYKESYYYELTRREKLGAELTLPVGIITILFGSITYFIQKFEVVNGYIPTVIMSVGFVTMIFSLAFSLYYLIRSYYNYGYEYFSTSLLVEKYYKELHDYYKTQFGGSSKIEPAFEQYLINTYCKCNDRNVINNDRKSSFLHKARTSIIVSLIAAIVAVGACNYDKANEISKSVFSRITLGKEGSMNVPNKSKQPDSVKPTSTPATPSTPTAIN